MPNLLVMAQHRVRTARIQSLHECGLHISGQKGIPLSDSEAQEGALKNLKEVSLLYIYDSLPMPQIPGYWADLQKLAVVAIDFGKCGSAEHLIRWEALHMCQNCALAVQICIWVPDKCHGTCLKF
jgi:hypothetical protein